MIRYFKNKENSFYFISILIVIFTRNFSEILNPIVYAEDGQIFLQRAIDYGIKSLTIPYWGYFHFIPQAIILCFYNILNQFKLLSLLPYLSCYTANILSAIICTYFVVSKRFSYIVEKSQHRFILIIITLIFSHQTWNEVWGNVTNFQWWSGLIIYFVIIDVINTKKIPDSFPLIIILTLIGFSTPLAIITFGIFVIVILYNIFDSSREKNIKKLLLEDYCWIKILMIIFPAIIQTVSAISTTLSSSRDLINFYELRNLLAVNFSFISRIFLKINHYVVAFVGLAIWFMCFVLSRKKRFIIYSFIFSLLLMILTYMKSGYYLKNSFKTCVDYYSNARYGFIPLTIASFVVFITLYIDLLVIKNKNLKYRNYIFFFISGILLLFNFNYKFPDRSGSWSHKFSYNNYIDFFDYSYDKRELNTTKLIEIPLITDYSWKIDIPFTLNDYIEVNSELYDLFIDSINGKLINENLTLNENLIPVKGWAIDKKNNKTFDAIIININGKYIATISEERQDDAEHFNNLNYNNSGFTVILPSTTFYEGENVVEFIMILKKEKKFYKKELIINVEKKISLL